MLIDRKIERNIFSSIQIKFLEIFCFFVFSWGGEVKINKLLRKCIWKHTGPRIAKAILKKEKKKARILALLDFKVLYNVTVTKIQ